MKKITLLFISLFTLSFFCFSQEVEVKTDTLSIPLSDISLHAVLSKPAKVKNPAIALIIAGSGATDLNGNQQGVENNYIKFLAEDLNQNNIATLRFDKRGIGKSSYSDFKESDLTIDLFAQDVESILSYLKEENYNNIYVIGHSEGSLLGLIALQKNNIKGFISLAGAGNSADIILKNQLKPKLPPAFYSQVEQIVDSLKAGDIVKNVPPQLNALFRPSAQTFLISWFKYSPEELIQNIHTPIIIINGNKDIQIDLNEAKILAKASKTEVIEIDNMNHVLKTISGDMQENIQSYTNPDLEINSDLITTIVNFISPTK
jgi:hypothetical protein